MTTAAYPEAIHADVETLWRFHKLDHELHPVDLAIGLGSHDGGVAVYAAELYQRGMFPQIVFSGANAPTTVDRFPRGEAVHFREIAMEHGVPSSAILTETKSTSTVENIKLTRELLAAEDISPESVLLISRPYQQRRAHAVAAKLWPEVELLCSGEQVDLDAYVEGIGEPDRVANMLVGDTQRLELQGESGEIDPQEIPTAVREAYERLISAGYTSRLIPAR